MRAFVLLSGGLDSTTALYKAVHLHGAENVDAVGIDYGQRHARERDFAMQTARQLGVDFSILRLGHQPKSMLTDPTEKLPEMSYSELPHGISPTYVPFRNGQMLGIIAAFAHAWCDREEKKLYGSGLEHASDRNANPESALIYIGAHGEDSQNWAYPDCTPEFMGAMANAIFIGTYQRVRLVVPFQHMEKHEIVLQGEELGVDWASTWSCYDGGQHHCGKCPTCIARKEAFLKAGVLDPTTYMDPRTPSEIRTHNLPF
jgi:7-cyano-7-deazaguanine synthase